MKPLKRLIPNKENFFDHQFYTDSMLKMGELNSFYIDNLVWVKTQVRSWTNIKTSCATDLNETIKQKNSES